MKFKFTLIYPGAQLAPIVVPTLDQWSTQTGSDEEWAEGAIPSVTLAGAFPTIVESEYLYVDYPFEDGIEYTITLSHTTSYNSGSSNPRTATLAILDNSFVTQFSEVDTFPPSPGGQDSITINFTANSTSTKIGLKASSGSDVTIVVDEVSGTSVDPNDLPQSLEISEPDGWKQAVLSLKRDQDFHSLIEFFDGSFIFYGDNGVVNGGLHFIEALEVAKGPDVTINLLIEIAPDDLTYETCFEGMLDLELGERLPKNKYRIPVIRDSFWSKFIKRWKTPVDLMSAVDLDGRPVEVIDPVILNAPSQIITYFGEYNASYSKTYPAINDSIDLTSLILGWDEIVIDDLKMFSLLRDTTTHDVARVLGIFEAPYDGQYTIEIDFTMSIYEESPDRWTHNHILDGFDIFPALNVYRTNNATRLAEYEYPGSPEVTLLTDGTDSGFRFNVTQVITLVRGEQVAITLEWLKNPSSEVIALNPTIFGIVPLIWKTDCALATTEAITLSGEQTIDGVMTSSDRVLVKGQGNPWENGIYVSAAGAWSRSTDMDSSDEFFDAAVYVTGGDFQSNTAFRQTEEVVSVGVDNVRFDFVDPSDERFRPFPFDVENNFLKITGNTTFRNSEIPGFLVHDAAAAIIDRLGLTNT